MSLRQTRSVPIPCRCNCRWLQARHDFISLVGYHSRYHVDLLAGYRDGSSGDRRDSISWNKEPWLAGGLDRIGGTDRSTSHMVLHDTIKAGLGLRAATFRPQGKSIRSDSRPNDEETVSGFSVKTLDNLSDW